MKKNMKILLFALVLFFLATPFVAGLGAAEVPGITPADFAGREAHWFWIFLASDMMQNAWLWIATTGVALVMGWLKWESSRKEKVVLFVAAGVRQSYEEYVRHAKAASADGKLSDDERREAVRQAIEYAVQYAKNDGFDLLKAYAGEALPALVDALVRKIRGEAAMAKSPLEPLLPDLAPSPRSV